MGDRTPELIDTHGTGYHQATRPGGNFCTCLIKEIHDLCILIKI